ncbi:hypothetical protein [Pseudotabrizicola sediminis]|nr:hypothetical protein [Pseudotabrizicola sediminis]
MIPPRFAITAAAWSALAHRIGRGMQIAVHDRDSAGPPSLG